MKKTSLIVFDIDGTLTDSVKQHQQAFTESLFEIGISEISSEFKTFKHHTDSFIAKEIYEKNLKQSFSAETLDLFENLLNNKIEKFAFREIKGAQLLVEKLETKTEFGICFATGSLRRPAEHKLKSIGVKFKEWQLVASNHIHEREGIVGKAIQNAQQYYQIKQFDRIISVGDGIWDLITAKNLHLEFVGVGDANRKVLLQNGAQIVLDDLTEFEK